MWRKQRDRAQRIAAHVDGLVMRRRLLDQCFERAAFQDQDAEIEELQALARDLSAIEIAPPTDFHADLARRLSMTGPATHHGASRDGNHRADTDITGNPEKTNRRLPVVSAGARPAWIGLLAAVAVVALVSPLGEPPVASAAEILGRSELALRRLVQPGQILYRRWRFVTTTETPDGVRRQADRVIHEWLDGANAHRVAGRWYASDGRLLSAYTATADRGELRPKVYFGPGVFGEARPALHIEPTRREFEQALLQFPSAHRQALRTYLARQYIYVPIAGEGRFNETMLDESQGASPVMPRLMLSADATVLADTPAYRVQIVDPARVRFNWRTSGPPRVRLARCEVARYIARDSYLSIRSEERYEFEDGLREFSSRELIETRMIGAGEMHVDPFELEVPEGTPVRQQSAVDLLSGVVRVLESRPVRPPTD